MAGSAPAPEPAERATTRRPAALATALLVGLQLAPLVGCGRKQVPLPPQVRRAETTRDLQVFQEGTDAVLTWPYPSMTTAGGPLPDVEAVQVWRLAAPAAQEPQGTSDRERETRQRLMLARGEQVALLEPSDLDSITQGPLLRMRDDLRAWHAAADPAEPQVLWYAVRTVCCRGRESELSNIARLRPALPPEPPEGLEASASAAGIELRWQPADDLAALVERAGAGDEWVRLTDDPLTEASYLDATATQDATWRYRLRSVRQPPDGGPVVGPPGPAVEVEHPDLYPPAAPQAVVCLPEGRRVVIRWEAVAGAAGYEVSRSGGDAPGRTWRVERTRAADDDAPLGELLYAVRALDDSGNLSEPGSCSTVVGTEP